MTADVSELVKRLRTKETEFGKFVELAADPHGCWETSQLYGSAANTLEAQSAIISEKNDLIDKLEAERETLITELERLLKQLGRKDLSI